LALAVSQKFGALATTHLVLVFGAPIIGVVYY